MVTPQELQKVAVVVILVSQAVMLELVEVGAGLLVEVQVVEELA
tara:strand:+ start:27 stop:158 length:132 start_codon:yes stop_codon:yes gene_type:complete